MIFIASILYLVTVGSEAEPLARTAFSSFLAGRLPGGEPAEPVQSQGSRTKDA